MKVLNTEKYQKKKTLLKVIKEDINENPASVHGLEDNTVKMSIIPKTIRDI